MIRHTVGLLVVGGACWLGYLVYANVLTLAFGWPHLVAEVSGIPMSHVAYYSANALLVFRVRPTWRTFAACTAIGLLGWSAFMTTSYINTDVLGWPSPLGTFLGAGANASSNLVLQQFVTFGWVAGGQHGDRRLGRHRNRNRDPLPGGRA